MGRECDILSRQLVVSICCSEGEGGESKVLIDRTGQGLVLYSVDLRLYQLR